MAGRAGLDHVQEIVLDGFVSHAILLAGGNGTADLQGATATETGLVLRYVRGLLGTHRGSKQIGNVSCRCEEGGASPRQAVTSSMSFRFRPPSS